MRMTFQKLNTMLLGIATLSLVITSCDKMPPPGNTPKTIFQTVATDSRFQLLAVAVTRAGLVDVLNNKSAAITLFAPTDEAFKKAGFKTPHDIAKAPVETLRNILLYHALNPEVKANQLPTAANVPIKMLSQKPTFITRKNTQQGIRVFVNGVSVIQADLDCINGVIHVIDRVLIDAVGNIVQTAISNPNLSFLVAAVLRASEGDVNVASVLANTSPLTVFAPTNDAFKKAGFATIEAIRSAPPSALTPILTYHVIAARVFSSDLTEGAEPATLNGGKVKISLQGGAKVKGKSNSTVSNIVITDILTTNGVVHVIDQVLLP